MNTSRVAKAPPQPSPQGGAGRSCFWVSSAVQKQFERLPITKAQNLNWERSQNEVAPSPLWGGLGRGFVQTANFGGRYVC